MSKFSKQAFVTIIDGQDAESETRQAERRIGWHRGPRPARGLAVGPGSWATEETFVSQTWIWDFATWMTSLISRVYVNGGDLELCFQGTRDWQGHLTYPTLASQNPLQASVRNSTGDFRLNDRANHAEPRKSWPPGLIVVRMTTILPQRLSLPRSVFVRQKGPAETPTRKNTGKGERSPWARIVWTEPEVGKEV